MATLTPAVLTQLRRAFVDICQGYSETTFEDKPLYIRHLSHKQHLQYDLLQARFEERARKLGAPTEAQRLIELRAAGLWSDQKDRNIANQKEGIVRFEEARKTVAQPSVLRGYDTQIAQEKEKLTRMLVERAELIKITCEVHAQRLLNDHYVITNLFSDKGLTESRFPPEVFEDFSDSEVEAILAVYHSAIDPCGDTFLRQLAVQDFFMSYYGLCGDKADSFYGRPICEMTYYQVRLANVAKYFKLSTTVGSLSIAKNTSSTHLNSLTIIILSCSFINDHPFFNIA